MKRAFSLLLVLVLCLAFVPLQETRAETTIDKISCGIANPRHEDRPGYNPYIWSGSHCHSDDVNSTYFKNDVKWIGPNGNIVAEGEGTFVYGEEYDVVIYVTADDGYVFSESLTTATLNGDSVEFDLISDTYAKLYGHFVAEPIYMVSDPEVIIHYPVAGNKPDYEPTVRYGSFSFGTSHSTGYNANFMKNDVCWEDLTDNTYFSPNGNETFVEGHQYRVSFYITPNFGYAFYGDYDPELYSATVDPEDEMGDHAHHTTSYQLVSDGSGYCEYTFPALPTRPTITTQPKSVTVSEGKTATFKVVAEGATSYKWQYQKSGSSTWTDVSKNGTSATYSLTTAARHNGYKYRCKVTNSAGTVYTSAVKLTVK